MITYHSSYVDLEREIEIIETRIRDLQLEKKYLLKNLKLNQPSDITAIDYTKDKVKGGITPLPLDRIVERINEINDSLETLYEMLGVKKQTKEKLERMLGELEGIEHQVAYYKYVKKMNLFNIADELGYSYDYIREISSKIRKSHKEPTKVLI